MFNKFKENALKIADIAKESASYIPDDFKNKIVNTVTEMSESALSNIKDSSSDDLTLNNEEVKQELSKYKQNAKPEDIEKVDKKLNGMQKGDLKKIWDKVLLLWDMTKDPKAPWESKAMAVGALIYTVSPIDAIPDVLPVLGLTDDAGVIAAAVAALGSSLLKYSDKKPTTEVDTSMNNEKLDIDNDLKSMKIIVSTLAQGAYADNNLSEEEETICFEIFDKFIFSSNGVFSKDKIESLSYSKKELKKIIADTFENPLSLKEIANYAMEQEEEESFYLYAYSVVSIDDDINDSEREFLNHFGELLELESFDKKNIERTYKKDWLQI
jgi:uncharacterized membrane protein YkvA (DUF1232 family)